MIADLHDARHHHALQALPRTKDALDLDALPCDQLGELVDVHLDGAELPQPRQDDVHATPSNCRRNRTSPSKSIRMSGIPYFKSAKRSMPIPNAKPV